jgi:hypothetical protein
MIDTNPWITFEEAMHNEKQSLNSFYICGI